MSEANHMDFQEPLVPPLHDAVAETWLCENQKGIEAIKKYAEENGSFSDYQRAF